MDIKYVNCILLYKTKKKKTRQGVHVKNGIVLLWNTEKANIGFQSMRFDMWTLMS